MTKRYHLLTVKGRTRNHCFNVIADDTYLQEWRDDGIDINPLVNEIPWWAADGILLKVWCWLQDIGLLKP
jgi:hypothetical protein